MFPVPPAYVVPFHGPRVVADTTLAEFAATNSAYLAQAPMHWMRIELHDALAVGGSLSPASYNLLIYVRVPDSWLDGEQINTRGKAAVLARLYGPDWESGNSDGSRYAVLEYGCRPLTRAEEEDGGWRKTEHSWYYRVNSSGELEKD